MTKIINIKERDIELACTQLLQLDGWRALKTDPCSDRARGKGFGEKGMADCLYIRYALMPREVPIEARILADVLWIEFKRPGGAPSPLQLQWHRDERLRGAVTWIAGVDFPASIDGFISHYRASGLDLGKV